MTPYGHARLAGEPVLIDWRGKAGTFPRFGTFQVFTLDGKKHPSGIVSEYALTFGGCTSVHHPESECPFLTAGVKA